MNSQNILEHSNASLSSIRVQSFVFIKCLSVESFQNLIALLLSQTTLQKIPNTIPNLCRHHLKAFCALLPELVHPHRHHHRHPDMQSRPPTPSCCLWPWHLLYPPPLLPKTPPYL